MRSLAAALILEKLGVPSSYVAPPCVDGAEMCAALAWAIAVCAAMGAHGEQTVAKCATSETRNAVTLVTALLDGGLDVADAATDALSGLSVIGVCHELFALSTLVGREVTDPAAVLTALYELTPQVR